MVEILVRVGSCEKDACDKKSEGCDGAAQFWKACSRGMNGSHVLLNLGGYKLALKMS